MTVEKIIKSFQKHQVLIVGDVMIDSYLWGSTNRVSPEAPVPIVNVTKQKDALLHKQKKEKKNKWRQPW